MKKLLICINLVYIFLLISGSVYAVGEKTISLGGEASWRNAENRMRVTEVKSVRPYPVLILSAAASSVEGYSAATGVLGNFTALTKSMPDMSLSFDEKDSAFFRDSAGNYKLLVPSDLEAADHVRSRAGTGAALFGRSGSSPNNSPLLIQPQSGNALFSPNNHIGDFTIEFWLYPQKMENGEQILTWVSAKPVNGSHVPQRITCSAYKNRFKWSFGNFFTSPNGNTHINIEFTGKTPVIPKEWSHHLIRFDMVTGLLEYLVDGSSEVIVYATSSGRESSEVFTPVIGNSGAFLLGERFVGLMDEFKIHSACVGRSAINRYIPAGGRMETGPIDLGQNSSGVIRINASGGRTRIKGTIIQNDFRIDGKFRFSDDTEMNFFIRASENPYLLNNARWVNFTPGAEISQISGRYVQIAVDFYPSADGESSPYLDELRIVYLPGEPPMPPRNLLATAVDGGVMLRWKHSPAENTKGYLVYYSSMRGELFGDEAKLGASPIDAGKKNSLFIDGLKNGTLYYFRVAAYDKKNGEMNYIVGEFSAEVTSRPLAGLALIGLFK
jgi:hypothetical protein